MRIAYCQWKSMWTCRRTQKRLRHARNIWPSEESVLQPGDYERDHDDDHQCPDERRLNPQAESSIIGIMNRPVESVESDHDCAFRLEAWWHEGALITESCSLLCLIVTSEIRPPRDCPSRLQFGWNPAERS